MALEGLALRGAQKAQEMIQRPMIGWSTEETIVTPRGDKTLITTDRTSFSMTALELAALVAGVGVSIWFLGDGPQKTAKALTSGIFGTDDSSSSWLWTGPAQFLL